MPVARDHFADRSPIGFCRLLDVAMTEFLHSDGFVQATICRHGQLNNKI
jgi:hypothetical protein